MNNCVLFIYRRFFVFEDWWLVKIYCGKHNTEIIWHDIKVKNEKGKYE